MISIKTLASKPAYPRSAPGGPFFGKGPQPSTCQLQRQDEDGVVSWWIRSGIIGRRKVGAYEYEDTTAYGGGTRYKTRAAARAAFEKIPAHG